MVSKNRRGSGLSECGSKAPAFSENVEKNENRLSSPKKRESFYEKRELSLAYKSESCALALRNVTLTKIFSLGLLTSDSAKPQFVEPSARIAEAEVRRPAVPGAVAQVAAADDAERATRRSSRVCYTPAGIIAIPILAPLTNVPLHVVQAPRVGLLRSNGMSFTSAI